MTSSLDSCSSPQKRRTIFRSHRETQIDAIYSASRISGRPITEARDPGQIRPGALAAKLRPDLEKMDGFVSVRDSFGNVPTVGGASIWSIAVSSNSGQFVVSNTPVTITG